MAAADIEGLFRTKDILLAVNKDGAGALTAVDDAHLTVVEEIGLGDGLVNGQAKGGEVLELQIFCHGHSTAEDETVVLRIGEIDLVGGHDFLHDETLTESLRVVVHDIAGMTGCLKTNVLLSHGAYREECQSCEG